MTSSHAFRRFAVAFGTAFGVFYVVALKLDLALFTVYPSLGIVLPGTHHSRDSVDPAMAFLAPAMYWYGWTATAALGALVVGLAAVAFPAKWTHRFGSWWWIFPVLAMIACIYLTLPWFRLQIGLAHAPSLSRMHSKVADSDSHTRGPVHRRSCLRQEQFDRPVAASHHQGDDEPSPAGLRPGKYGGPAVGYPARLRRWSSVTDWIFKS